MTGLRRVTLAPGLSRETLVHRCKNHGNKLWWLRSKESEMFIPNAEWLIEPETPWGTGPVTISAVNLPDGEYIAGCGPKGPHGVRRRLTVKGGHFVNAESPEPKERAPDRGRRSV